MKEENSRRLEASGAAREELEAALAETDALRDRCDELGEWRMICWEMKEGVCVKGKTTTRVMTCFVCGMGK